MQSNYYYLIQPTLALQEAINHKGDAEVLPFLTEPALWTRVEGGLVTAEYFTDAKIIYQCQMYDLHINQPVYQEIFGHLPISEATFDIFWTIQRFEIDDNFDDVLREISVAALERILLPEGSTGKRYYDDLLGSRRADDYK